ncbi:MAG: PLDc N-terminal domain-containing protein [Bacteroidales bacterium]|nr:PLDc N-terminal domain-containing protein [Bacteroidales bacterium]
MIIKILILIAALPTPVYMFLLFFHIGSDDTILFYIDILLYFIVYGLLVTIYFIIHAKRNVKLNRGSKTFWIVVLIFTNLPGQLLYWVFEILPEKTTTDTFKV